MEQQLSQNQADFEAIKQTKNGIEFWSARDLMPLLEYSKWEKFSNTIDKAKLACAGSGLVVEDHFPRAGKMVLTGSGAKREIEDYELTRYACYLIAQNGDSRKQAIALAQTYFASQTRKQELAHIVAEDRKRVEARDRLTQTEKKFSGVLAEHGVDSPGIAEIRSSGDQVLFGGHSTREMKARYSVATTKPLADYLPTVTLKAKDLAAEMTTVNTLQNKLSGKPTIKHEHEQNNRSVRNALLERNIQPEILPAQEDINKVKRRLERPPKALANES